MTSVPTGKCGPCCSVAASGSTAIHRAAAAPEISGQWMSVQSRGGTVEVIERSVSFGPDLQGSLSRFRKAAVTCVRTGAVPPIMGQNDRRSPTMNPALLPRALTAGLLGRCPGHHRRAGAQTLDKVSFGTNWVAGGGAGRIFPGGGRRHLQAIRARRHHRARRPQRQQPHAADRRQARLLPQREHAAVVRCRRQQRARGRGRRHVPEGSAGLPDPSGIEGRQTRRISSR